RRRCAREQELRARPSSREFRRARKSGIGFVRHVSTRRALATLFFQLAMLRHPIRAIGLFTLSGSFALTACGGGGGGGGAPPPPVDPVHSSFTVTPAFGTSADGAGSVDIDIVLADASGKALPGRTVVLEATGFGNALVQPPNTDAGGKARGRMTTTIGEKK